MNNMYVTTGNDSTPVQSYDYQEAATAIERTDSTQGKVRALLELARPIAHWFAPGNQQYKGVGEIAGDTSTINLNTTLKDIAVLQGQATMYFVGWLHDSNYRQDGIYGQTHTERIRVVALSRSRPEADPAVLEASWQSRCDRPGWQTSPPAELGQAHLEVKASPGPGQLLAVQIVSKEGTLLHGFESGHSFARITVPFHNFDGIDGPICRERLYRFHANY